MLLQALFCKKWVNYDILKTDANFAIGSVWANHCDSAEIFMLGGLDKLEDLSIARKKDIALCEFCFICLCHISIR